METEDRSGDDLARCHQPFAGVTEHMRKTIQRREGSFLLTDFGSGGLPMPSWALSLVKSRASKCKGGAGGQKAKSWRSELGTRLTL